MEQNNKRNMTIGIWFDWPFIFRTLFRWMAPALAVATVLMVGVYIMGDRVMQDTCSASAIVAVVPREYTNGNLSDGSVNNAVTKEVNMWNSNSMMKLIKDSNKNLKITGSINASAVNGTNLIRITAVASTAQETFYILNYALQNYRQIINNFEVNYLPIVLTDNIKNGVNVVKPNPLKYAVLVFAAAFVGFMGIVGLWSLLTDLIHSETQAEGLLEVPVYETLPVVKKRKGRKAVLITDEKMSLSYLQGIDKMANRMMQHLERNGQKTVLVTSVQENEGKSTVATNLAISLARRGNKVLLMDLDFRKPSVAKILDHAQEWRTSCSKALETYVPLDQIVEKQPNLWNLDVIWQFDYKNDADQFMETSGLKYQLDQLAKKYDIIIIDTAPIGPIRDTDVVAQMVDASLLVVREEFNRAGMINDITDQLEEYKAPCMGIVLNRRKFMYRNRKAPKNYRSYYGHRGNTKERSHS